MGEGKTRKERRKTRNERREKDCQVTLKNDLRKV